MATKRWQDGMVVYFGIYLFFSPLIFRFYSEIPVRSWNFYLIGVGTVALAAMAMRQRTSWQELANVALGLWMVISPWIVGFSRNIDARNTALAVGVLIALVSLGAYYSYRPQSGERSVYTVRREA